MTTFIILAALLVAAALFLVLRPLLGSGTSIGREAKEIRRRLRQIDADVDAGLISKSNAEGLRQDLSAALMKKVSGGDETAPSKSYAPAILMLLTIPALTVWIYLSVGLPDAIDLEFKRGPQAASTNGATGGGDAEHAGAAADGESAPSLDQAVAGLKARLKQQPDNIEGWVLLGRSYMQMGQHQDAVAAFERARQLAPEEPWILVDLVEARFMASGEPMISATDVALLEQAVELDPSHQKGVWMLGIAAYQRGDFAAAATRFERLQGMLEPGSPVADTVADQLRDARARAGLPDVAARPAPAQASTPEIAPGSASQGESGGSAEGPRLMVAIDLAPALRDRVSGNEILFVFAKAANGPPMPLAVQRLAAGAIPTTVVLDSSMSMTPQLTLETFPEVVISARISRTGNATAQAGDLEGTSAVVANTHAETINLTIDSVVGG